MMRGGAVLLLAAVLLNSHYSVHGTPSVAAVKAGVETADKAYDLANKVITEQNAKLTNRHKETMKEPDKIMNGEKQEEKADAFGLKMQKVGGKNILIEQGQGDSGFGTYQMPSLRIKETLIPPPAPPKPPQAPTYAAGGTPYMYPNGLGPVLFNKCYGDQYSKTSPCFNEKQYFIKKGLCAGKIPAANFIGVGFDGRGFYSAESRKTSLVSRKCLKGKHFLGMKLPDTMNAFPIFHTKVESNSYTSTESYMRGLRKQAGVSNSKSMFKAEASKFKTSTTANVNVLGGMLSAHASGSYGREGNTKSGKSSSSANQDANASRNQRQARNLFAIMNVNIILFEISLDEVKPEDLSLSFLKDYVSLPASYLTPGAETLYQE